MREIGTGHDESVCAFDQFGERKAEGALYFVVLIAHDDGNELEITEHSLQEGELDFESVFALLLGRGVAATGELDERICFGEFGGEFLVHRDIAERGGIGIAVVNRNEGEGLEMRGSNHDHAIKLFAFEERVAVSSHFGGVDVARVGGNDSHQVSWKLWDGGLREIVVYHAAEFVWRCGIELAGNRGLTDYRFLVGSPAITRKLAGA